MQESGWVRVTLVKGIIVGCLIRWKDGEILSGSEALYIVERLGSLDWNYTPLTSKKLPSTMPPQARSSPDTPTAPQPFAAQEKRAPTVQAQGAASHNPSQLSLQPASVLIRARSVSSQQFAEWPRQYRSVFNLVDGNNSIEKIASLLAKPYEAITQILIDLYTQGVVMQPYRPSNNSDQGATNTFHHPFDANKTDR